MRFDYLKPSIEAVIEGFEDHERIYALEQGNYIPIRTLMGDGGLITERRFSAMSKQQKQPVREPIATWYRINEYPHEIQPVLVVAFTEHRVTVLWIATKTRLQRQETILGMVQALKPKEEVQP